MVICEYEKLYSDTPEYYHKLLAWLSVDFFSENENYFEKTLEKSKKLRKKSRENSEEAHAYITEHADIDTANKLAEKFGL